MQSCIGRRLLCSLFALVSASCFATEGATPTAVTLTEVATGLSGPTAIAAPNDGSGRLFVVENLSGTGRVRIINAAGTLLPTPYYTHAISGGSGSEQGMLGLAIDPDFASNGTLYLTYTAPGSDPRLGSTADQVLIRLVASSPAANVFAGNEQVVLRIPDLYSNHNGGNIQFGPDNRLYWGMGDGGSGGDPNGFSQDLWKKTVSGKEYYLLGKMLRLDVRNPASAAASNQCGATAGQPAQYSIPADNPYSGATDKCGEIWLYGLRNPWRWSFDRKTGDLVIGDVGQNQYEEIDFRAAGSSGNRNYGWKMCEGNHYYSPSGSGLDCPATTGTVAPVIEYSHSGGACSTTGGYVYRGPVSELRGKYLFSDYCDGKIRVADANPSATTWTYTTMAGTPSMNAYSFGEDAEGNAYVISGGGKIYRFDGPSTTPTYVITPQAGAGGTLTPSQPQTVDENETVSFTVTPNSGFAIAAVTGCGGTLSGATYTTAPAIANCTVSATFSMIPPPLTWTVTPLAGSGGSLIPGVPQEIVDGQTTAFTLEPDAGYNVGTVTGCSGSLVGLIYTTAPITADCTVEATFVQDDTIFQDGFDP